MDKNILLTEIEKYLESNTDNRTEIIPVRLSPAEKALLKLRAEEQHLNLSEYIRTLLFQNAQNA